VNDQGDLTCVRLSHLHSQHEKNESLSENQNIRISEYQRLSEHQNMKPRTNYNEGHWDETNNPLFCDPFSSCRIESESEIIQKDEYSESNCNVINVADIGEKFMGSSNALHMDRSILDSTFEMERKDRVLKRSTDQIVALFSKRQRSLSTESSLNRYEFKKGMEDPHQMEYNKTHGNKELPIKTEDYLYGMFSTDDSNISLYTANKGNFVHGAVASRIVRRPIAEFSKVEG